MLGHPKRLKAEILGRLGNRPRLPRVFCQKRRNTDVHTCSFRIGLDVVWHGQA